MLNDPFQRVVTAAETFPMSSLGWNVLAVLILYGPAYLANTGAVIFGKYIPKFTGMPVFRIDRGAVLKDGRRILGDGKTWNGFVGGGIFAGMLLILAHSIWHAHEPPAHRFLLDPLVWANGSEWFYIGGEWGAAFLMGFVLGIGTMLGDSVGSFIKRRRGHIREGDESSKSLFLDTLPFAIGTFAFGLLFFQGQIIAAPSIIIPMIVLLVFTPVLHRVVNVGAYRLNLKDVPY